jgi:hypothetical protein
VIISPIELLSRFNISFVLHSNKNSGEKEMEVEEVALEQASMEKLEAGYSESEGS